MSAVSVLKVLPPSRPAASGVYRSLEHWRGVAALWVMLYHAIGAETKPLHPLVEPLKIPFRSGWLGVHLFFVISGYCIGANVHSLRAKGMGAVDFLRDRFCRILPTYWAAFGVTILLAAVAGKFNHMAAADNFPAGVRAWVGDLLLIQPYLGTKPYVIVYWTLNVELGFYLLVSVLFALASLSVHLAVGLSLALTLATVWTPPGAAWLTLACWPEFVCGVLIFQAIGADRLQRRTRRNLCLGGVVALGALGWMATVLTGTTSHPTNHLPFAATFALILYALHPFDEAINRYRGLRWLSFCGLFSYSLYLLHFPVGMRVYGIGRRFSPLESPFYGLLFVAFCVVSVLFSYGFYRMVEMRFEVWRRRFKARPVSAVA